MDLCAGRASKSHHLFPRLPGAGSPCSFRPQESQRLWTTAPSASPFGRGRAFLGKGPLWRKEFPDTNPGLFLPAHSTGSYHSGHHFLQGSGCPTPPAGRGDVLPPCGRFLELQAPERSFGRLSLKAYGLQRTRALRPRPGAGHRKRIQEGADRGSQFPEVNLDLTHRFCFKKIFFSSVWFLKTTYFKHDPFFRL